MALTRKALKAMGLSDEQVDSVIEMHTETVDALKESRDTYKTDAEKLPELQAELDKLKAKVGEDGKNPFEVKYNALKEEFDQYKNEITGKETARAKEEAYKELLKSAGISEKRISAILKVTDLKSLKLDAEGKLENVEDLTNTIKTEWADFIATEKKEGAGVPTPPEKEKLVDYDKLSDAEYYKQTYEASKKK